MIVNLKATKDAAAFYSDTQRMMRKATSFGELTLVAQLLDSADYHALPKSIQDDLDAQFRDRSRQVMGMLV